MIFRWNNKLQRKKLPKHFEKVQDQIERGHVSELAFLHIPKTGGTAITVFLNDLCEHSYSIPLKLPHAWTLRQLVSEYPQTKVGFLIRDPLERTISSFNSRLRQGRPTWGHKWSPGEGASYSIFRTVENFLKASLSDDDFDISAVRFAHDHISLLKFNYVHYFESPHFIQEHIGHIGYVGEISNSLEFWKQFFGKLDVPENFITEHFAYKHVAKKTTEEILSAFSDEEIRKLRSTLAEEYAIYNSLKKLAL